MIVGGSLALFMDSIVASDSIFDPITLISLAIVFNFSTSAVFTVITFPAPAEFT